MRTFEKFGVENVSSHEGSNEIHLNGKTIACFKIIHKLIGEREKTFISLEINLNTDSTVYVKTPSYTSVLAETNNMTDMDSFFTSLVAEFVGHLVATGSEKSE